MKANLNRALVALAALALAGTTQAAIIQLDTGTTPSTQVLPGVNASGGAVNASVANYWSQPTGTGVFNPFLSLRNEGGGSEEFAFNTNGTVALYNDEHRPAWNKLIQVGSLANVNGNYAFVLDANEPGASKSLISIDNLRVYVSSSDNTAAVGNFNYNSSNPSSSNNKLDLLGTLVFGMNTANWINLNANQESIGSNANGGSGQSDMVLLIPISLFTAAGANANSYVFLFDANGHNGSVESDATDGYEEWNAVTGSTPPIPDGGSTLILLGMAMGGMGFIARRSKLL